MMLRVDEVMSLRFENINHVPGLEQDEYFDVTLPPRKATQTGTRGRWRLWGNDQTPWLCPKRMQILLARVYGPDFTWTGSLFRQIDSSGAVLMNKPMVCCDLSLCLLCTH